MRQNKSKSPRARVREKGERKRGREGREESEHTKVIFPQRAGNYEKGRTTGCWSGNSNIQLTMEYLKKIVFFFKL